MKILFLLMSVMVSTSYADDVLLFKNEIKFNHTLHKLKRSAFV